MNAKMVIKYSSSVVTVIVSHIKDTADATSVDVSPTNFLRSCTYIEYLGLATMEISWPPGTKASSRKPVDQCTDPSGRVEDCAIFDIQSDSDSQQCTFQPPAILANDNPQGPRQGLPGNVPVQAGSQATLLSRKHQTRISQ